MDTVKKTAKFQAARKASSYKTVTRKGGLTKEDKIACGLLVITGVISLIVLAVDADKASKSAARRARRAA